MFGRYDGQPHQEADGRQKDKGEAGGLGNEQLQPKRDLEQLHPHPGEVDSLGTDAVSGDKGDPRGEEDDGKGLDDEPGNAWFPLPRLQAIQDEHSDKKHRAPQGDPKPGGVAQGCEQDGFQKIVEEEIDNDHVDPQDDELKEWPVIGKLHKTAEDIFPVKLDTVHLGSPKIPTGDINPRRFLSITLCADLEVAHLHFHSASIE